MARTKHGSPLQYLQPGWSVDEDENGLLTGECVYEGDIAFAGGIRLGTLHPYDYRLTAYRRNFKQMANGKARVTLSYIGVSADPTPMFIEHPGGSGQDAIETHPDFKDLAGTPSDPRNGAVFDEESGEFIGFLDPENSLFGIKQYIVPSVIVNLTYYTHYVPFLSNVGRISYFSPPDLYRPPNVRNFLLVGSPYRRIGNLFQVTLQLLGSGPNGWNTRVY